MEVPEAFGIIEPGLYRASDLQAFALPFLRTLELRSILVLDPGTPSSYLAEFAAQEKIELLHLGTQPWRSSFDVQQQHYTWAVFSRALKHALDSRYYPLMVLDTNIFTGIVRRLENWAISAVLSDYNSYAGLAEARATPVNPVFLEQLEIIYGSTDNAEELMASRAKSESFTPLIIVDLPEPKFRPDWVRRFRIGDRQPK